MGRTWWGQRFLSALEAFTDPARLKRGRTYASGARVVRYGVEHGVVTAQVRGSVNHFYGVFVEPVYTVEIVLEPIRAAQWKRVVTELSSRASAVTRLLLNEMPDGIDEVFAAEGLHLLPHGQEEFQSSCTCPDWANPCKHIAGVYYLLAADLDSDPFLLFELRGLSRDALRRQLRASPLGAILADSLEPPQIAVEPVQSYRTRPVRQPVERRGYAELWAGAKHLPAPAEGPRHTVSGLLIKMGGDFPPFWRADASFVEVMEGLYDRVRSKSRDLK